MRYLIFWLMAMACATGTLAQDDSQHLVINLAPAVCLTPLGRSVHPVPYTAVEAFDPQSEKAAGTMVPMDGCGQMGLQGFFSSQQASAESKRRSEKQTPTKAGNSR